MNFQLATEEHEEALRDMLRHSPMPGWVRIAYGRDPDLFQAMGVQGRSSQVLIATEGGKVVGMGSRSIRPVYVNGERMDTGYLGGLRLMPEARSTSALGRGYAELRELHQKSPVPVYLSTVLDSNSDAKALLTSGRAGLPHYLDYGQYFTYAINLNRRRRKQQSSITVRRGDEIGRKAIVNFLGDVGRQRQFFPVVDETDFDKDHMRGLNLADFRVAVLGDEIAGVAATWDQSPFKQYIVHGYSASAQMIRPIANVALRLAGFRPLPSPGQTLGMIHVAFHCVRNDDPIIMQTLLEQIYCEQQGGTHHFLVIGLHERDPFRRVMSRFLAFPYASRLYLVCWDDGLEFAKQVDPAKIPYLELATL